MKVIGSTNCKAQFTSCVRSSIGRNQNFTRKYNKSIFSLDTVSLIFHFCWTFYCHFKSGITLSQFDGGICTSSTICGGFQTQTNGGAPFSYIKITHKAQSIYEYSKRAFNSKRDVLYHFLTQYQKIAIQLHNIKRLGFMKIPSLPFITSWN